MASLGRTCRCSGSGGAELVVEDAVPLQEQRRGDDLVVDARASSVTQRPSGRELLPDPLEELQRLGEQPVLVLAQPHVQVVHGAHGRPGRRGPRPGRPPARPRRCCAATGCRSAGAARRRPASSGVPCQAASPDRAQPGAVHRRGVVEAAQRERRVAGRAVDGRRTAASQVAVSGTGGSARSEKGRLSSRRPRASSTVHPGEAADGCAGGVDGDPGLRGEPVGPAHGGDPRRRGEQARPGPVGQRRATRGSVAGSAATGGDATR